MNFATINSELDFILTDQHGIDDQEFVVSLKETQRMIKIVKTLRYFRKIQKHFITRKPYSTFQNWLKKILRISIKRRKLKLMLTEIFTQG